MNPELFNFDIRSLQCFAFRLINTKGIFSWKAVIALVCCYVDDLIPSVNCLLDPFFTLITVYSIFMLFSIAVEGGQRKPYFAQDLRGAGLSTQDVPEWKKATFGGAKGSYGRKTNLSILEQRQSLPIFKLRDELVKVCVFFSIVFILR